jgi:hypothetical protein
LALRPYFNGLRKQRLAEAVLVPANRQHVVDAEVLELDEKVLGLLAGKPDAKHVGHGIDVVLVLDERTNTQGARPLALDLALDAAGRLFVDDLGAMARGVDERRVVGRQVLDQAQKILHIPAPQRRNDLVTDQGLGGPLQVLSDFHDDWRQRLAAISL